MLLWARKRHTGNLRLISAPEIDIVIVAQGDAIERANKFLVIKGKKVKPLSVQM